MSNRATVVFTIDGTSGDLRDTFVNSNPDLAASNIANFMSGLVSGNKSASLSVKINTGDAVQASGELTCSSVAADDTAVINGVTLTAVDKREKTQVTCTGDTAGSLNNTYFVFHSANDATKYYMWYNVDDGGTDPAVANAIGVQVAISAGDNASTVASVSRAQFDPDFQSDFIETGATDKIVFQNVAVGSTTDAVDTGSTGFTISVQIQGGSVGADEFQISEDDDVTASNLADSVNADEDLAQFVSASANDDVATITAVGYGIQGNTITIAGTGGVSAGDSRLADGTEDTSATSYGFGR